MIASNVAFPPTITDSIPITSSSSSNLIPITPCATLPIGRTSFSSNVIHKPFLVTNTTLSSPSVKRTPINSSSSFKVIPCNPFFLVVLYSVNAVFLINPFFVAINRYFPSAKF